MSLAVVAVALVAGAGAATATPSEVGAFAAGSATGNFGNFVGLGSAPLVVGLSSMGLAGATQSFAANQAASRQPRLTPQNSGTTQGLIAVSPVNKRVVWASGRGGTFALTTDGGATWRAGVVPGAEALQFRDVEGVSDSVAYLLSIGNGADSRIYKTTDGGATWSLQFQNQDPNAFYDCFAFWTPTRGFAQSDSVNGQFPVVRTTNGQTWQSIAGNEPAALPGESFFASSGTCVATEGKNNAWAVTGGASPSRVLVTRDGGDTWNAYDSPLRGSPSAGLFSVAFRDAHHGMVGGGDLDPAAPPFDQTATSDDGGKTWAVTPHQPNIGTVFGLSYTADAGKARANGKTVVVTGPGGSAWTPDEGNRWFSLPGVTDFWAVAFGSPQTGWLVGTGGRILRVDF
jgi:photosystem II stability/assembly factor-like uncharacterized protein